MVGFPHSEILGSKLIRSSPRLIAAYYVLHRLCTPRHPLDALKTLDRSHYLYPQHHQPQALLYAQGFRRRTGFLASTPLVQHQAEARSHTKNLMRDQKKNQLSRRCLCLPEGVGSNGTNMRSLYDVKISGQGTPKSSTRPNLAL